MTVATWVAEVIGLFNSLPAEVLIGVSGGLIVGATGHFTNRVAKAGR